MKLKNLILVLFLQLIIFGCSEEENYSKPIINTSEVSEITNNSAICGGDLVCGGGKTVRAMGLVWHTSPNPTLQEKTGKTTELTVIGEFKSNLTDLTIDTKYFVRAYATYESGTTYGKEKVFSTKDNTYIEMVRVRGGTFLMGSADDEYRYDPGYTEKPLHSVTLSSFEIGKYEVTQAQWKAVMGSNPSYRKGDNLPVEQVNWYDIQTFLTKLNIQTGKTYRLPTEAEWECAACGGPSSKGYIYAGSNTCDRVSWNSNTSGGKTHPVGMKQPNELGIYDMSGNVSEICRDWFSESYYSNSPTDNPSGPAIGYHRIIRGGGYVNSAEGCRVSVRRCTNPNFRDSYCGFRVVQVQ